MAGNCSASAVTSSLTRMSTLRPDVALSVHLDAICGRNQYTKNPGPVVEEIRAASAGHTRLRDVTVGEWVGYFRAPETTILCDALLVAFPDAQDHVATGEARRGVAHSSAGFHRNATGAGS